MGHGLVPTFPVWTAFPPCWGHYKGGAMAWADSPPHIVLKSSMRRAFTPGPWSRSSIME